jgi:hypothetical protein
MAQTAPSAAAPHAQADDDVNEKARKTLYEEGLELARAGRWSDAADRFRKVVELRSSTKALLALATAEQQSGHLATAFREFQTALSDARAAGQAEEVTLAQQGLHDLDPRVPRVQIIVSVLGAGSSGAVEVGARATLDGQPIAVGAFVEVDPGPHGVVVTVDGIPPASTSFNIAEGQRRLIPVELPAPPPPATVPVPTTPAPSPPPVPDPVPAAPDKVARHPPPWGLIALATSGAAVAAAGAYLDLSGLSEHNALASCTTCTQQNVDNARRDMWVGTTMFWVGSAAVATSALLYWLRPRDATPPSEPHTIAFVAPTPGGARGGVAVTF